MSIRKLSVLPISAAFLALGCNFSPVAASTYAFDSAALGITATITTSDTFNAGMGGYDITGISGTTWEGTILNLAPPPFDLERARTIVFPNYYDNSYPSNIFYPGPDPLRGAVAFNLILSKPSMPSFFTVGALWSTGSATNFGVYIPASYTNYYLGEISAGAGTITAAVPEPETYAMMLAGLGMLGFVARRRKQKTA
jgi:hypothetical protein